MKNDMLPRQRWACLLSQLPAAEIRQAAARFGERYEILDITLPQSGLGLLKLQDGALGEAYFLGEIPVARARVALIDRQGIRHEGAATLLDDRAAFVRDIAILDAALANGLSDNHEIETLLVKGRILMIGIENQRKTLLEKTRVDFSLLGEEVKND